MSLTQVRINNSIGGFGAPVAATDQTITLNGSPGWPTLASDEFIKIVIDPTFGSATPNPLFEIAYVIAPYTAGQSTDIPVNRGLEGTQAVAHAITAVWFAGPTALDLSGDVTSVFGRTGAVVAENADYYGVVAAALSGATAATRYVGGTASGAPTTGTFDLGDFVIDQTGFLWVCTVAGSPGTWVQAGGAAGVTSFNTRTGSVVPGDADYLAVATGGLTGATAAARFVGGTASGAPTTGTFDVGDLAVDQTGKAWICTAAGSPGTWVDTGASAGVASFNSRTGAVVPGDADYLAVATGGLTGATAATRYVGGTASGAPTSGTFDLGDFTVAQSGAIWVCTVAGTPGTWAEIGGAPSGPAGGVLSGDYPDPGLSSSAEAIPDGWTATTQAAGDDSTKIATTAYANAAVAVETSRAESAEALLAPLSSPALTGTPTAPTPTASTDSTQIATTAYATAAVGVETTRAESAEALLAPLASAALTGTPTAPTAAASTDSTQVATTAYTTAAVAVETSRAENAEALLAPLASPSLTGTPTVPTAAAGTSTTQAASTAFVGAAVGVETTRAESAEGLLAPLASPALTGSPTAPTRTALTNSTAIATTAYTDSAVAVALSTIPAQPVCEYATAAALPANTYANGTSGVGATLTATADGALSVDGVAVVAGQRVLVQNEATAANNGIYTVTDTGSSTAVYVLTRATDFDTGVEMGAAVLVPVDAQGGTSGTVNNGKIFLSVTSSSFTVGTTAISFVQVGGTYTAGTGLTLSGNQFAITSAVVDAAGAADEYVPIANGSGGYVWGAQAAGGSGVGFGDVAAKTASYTVASGDSGNVLTFNGSSLTVTLPASAPTEPWSVTILDLNASALTIDPNGLELNGSTVSVSISTGQAVTIWSDGANYEYGAPSSVTSPDGTITVTDGTKIDVVYGTIANTAAEGDDSRITGALQTSGGTMSGPVAMGANQITGLADGTAASDAAAFGQIPTALPPSGAAGGSLTGTYPDPTIATIPSTATGTTQAALTDDTTIATTAYTDTAVGVETSRAENAEALLAPLASPSLTGTPTAPTAVASTDSTQIATTAYANAAVAAETSRAESAEALLAPLASPTFTGITTAPEFTVSGLTGATAASRYVGGTASGAPTTGTFDVGDFVIDQTGTTWICTAAGSPGTWSRSVSYSGTASDGEAPVWNGTDWVPSLLVGDVAGSVTGNTVEKLQGNTVSGSAPTSNQALLWTGSEWAPTTIGQAAIGGAVIPVPPSTQPTGPTVGELFIASADTGYTLPTPVSGSVLTVLAPAGTTPTAPVTLTVADTSTESLYGGAAGAGATVLTIAAPGLVVLEAVSATAWWTLADTSGISSFNGRVGAVLPVAGDYPGNTLGYVSYAPATTTTFQPTTTGGALDSTALTVPFAVPASGAVIVELSAYAFVPYGTAYVWYLLGHGTSTQYGPNMQPLGTGGLGSGLSIGVMVTAMYALTGLTPGASMQFDWAHSYSGQDTCGVTVSSTQGGTNGYGAASMMVSAA